MLGRGHHRHSPNDEDDNEQIDRTTDPAREHDPTQAALLLIVASAGKDGMDPDTREARTLTAAMEDFACELSILGIKAPTIAPR